MDFAHRPFVNPPRSWFRPQGCAVIHSHSRPRLLVRLFHKDDMVTTTRLLQRVVPGEESTPPLPQESQPAQRLARLQQENRRLQRRLEQLTALAQVAVKEPDQGRLCLRLAEATAELLDAEQAMVGIVSEEGVYFESIWQAGELRKVKWLYRSGDYTAGWVLAHKRPLLISTTGQHDQVDPRLVAEFGCRTLLAMPVLNHQGHVLGVIELHNQRYGRPFTDNDVTLAQTIALQVAPALERAQFYGKMEGWANAVANLLAFNTSLNRQLEPEVLIHRLVEHAAGFVGASGGLAGLADGGRLRADGYWQRGRWQPFTGAWSHQEGMPGWVHVSACTYLTNDYPNDKLANATFSHDYGVKSALCVPIIDAYEEVLGFFEIHNKGGGQEPFTWSDAQFLESLANTAAVAIRNGWLLRELQTHRTQLRALAAHNVSILEAERQRIARELHDESGQALIGVKLNLQVLAHKIPTELPALRAEVDDLRQQINEATAQLKGLARKLRPPTLDQLGLQVALQQLVTEFAERTAIHMHYTTVEGAIRLPPAVETACYRIVQEALTNVARHAAASEVWITLGLDVREKLDFYLQLTIEDNGRGFVVKQEAERGLGLLGMQERSLTLGGVLTIESQPGAGAMIHVTIPLPRQEASHE